MLYSSSFVERNFLPSKNPRFECIACPWTCSFQDWILLFFSVMSSRSTNAPTSRKWIDSISLCVHLWKRYSQHRGWIAYSYFCRSMRDKIEAVRNMLAPHRRSIEFWMRKDWEGSTREWVRRCLRLSWALQLPSWSRKNWLMPLGRCSHTETAWKKFEYP